MIKLRTISLKQLFLMALLLLSFAGSILFLFGAGKDEKKFHAITSSLFRDEMTSNTLDMHYTLAHPENFGIDYSPTLSFYDRNQAITSFGHTKDLLEELQNIDPEKLTSTDRYTCILLMRTLENNLALSSFAYYEEPLSPSSGVQSQLPILFAEYSFRTQRDVEDYLTLLGQIPDYFDSLLTYEREKKAAGLFMAASSADKIISQCRNIITKEELSLGKHFLQSTFSERLNTLSSMGLLSEEQVRTYTAQNNHILENSVFPAYLSMAEGIEELKDSSIPLKGVASKPDGAAYYRLYLTHVTGSYRDIPEIRMMLLETFSKEWNLIRELSDKFPQASLLYAEGSVPDFPLAEENAILADLKKRMQADFPLSNEAKVRIKSVSKSLEEYSAPAFYLTPPVDDFDNNVIYVNQKLCSDSLELYTTLAHEGFPGHMYQTVFNDQYITDSKENKIRFLLWYGGYLEGWAMYSEFFAYDQAAQIFKDQGDLNSSIYVQLEKHQRSLQLCLYSLLDIMINYEGVTLSQTAEILAGFGITSSSSAEAIYSYIAEEPCNYLKYYLGYLELWNLKEKAKETWGDSYSDLRFHRFYLESGPSDFLSLSEKLESEGL